MIIVSKCISKLTLLRPPRASPNSLDYGLQVPRCIHSILASKCISKLDQPRPRSESLNSLYYGLQLHLSSLDLSLQVYLKTCSIMASNCNSEFTWSRPPSASQNSPNHGLRLHLWIHLISAWKCISKLNRSRQPISSWSSLDWHSQVHLESISSTACSQSRYTVCRFFSNIDPLIHWYIDENTHWIHKFQKSLNDK